jgi:hypothetical protein
LKFSSFKSYVQTQKKRHSKHSGGTRASQTSEEQSMFDTSPNPLVMTLPVEDDDDDDEDIAHNNVSIIG